MSLLGKKQAERIIQILSEVREYSTMKNALFSLDERMPNRVDTLKIKKATNLWRASWITQPLENVIEQLEEIYKLSK